MRETDMFLPGHVENKASCRRFMIKVREVRHVELHQQFTTRSHNSHLIFQRLIGSVTQSKRSEILYSLRYLMLFLLCFCPLGVFFLCCGNDKTTKTNSPEIIYL